MLRAGHDNLSPFKIHDFRLSSRQADNQLAGKSLSHMHIFGYNGKKRLKYVIIHNIYIEKVSNPVFSNSVLTKSIEVKAHAIYLI